MIEIGVSLEIAAMLLAAVGAAGTWIHNLHKKEDRAQRERHHREMRAARERHRRERDVVAQRLRKSRARAGLAVQPVHPPDGD